MKTKTITVSGGFHNSDEIHIRARTAPRGGILLSARQAKRINTHMCGMSGCTCGPHHGWEVEGTTRSDLSEAMYFALND